VMRWELVKLFKLWLLQFFTKMLGLYW